MKALFFLIFLYVSKTEKSFIRNRIFSKLLIYAAEVSWDFHLFWRDKIAFICCVRNFFMPYSFCFHLFFFSIVSTDVKFSPYIFPHILKLEKNHHICVHKIRNAHNYLHSLLKLRIILLGYLSSKKLLPNCDRQSHIHLTLNTIQYL